jgi:hypothetical protein
MSSSRASAISWTRGASASTRRTVNAAVTSLRSRVWSGGFMLSRCVFIAAFRSGGIASMCGRPPALTSAGCASSSRASAYPVTTHAGVPVNSMIFRTGPVAASSL